MDEIKVLLKACEYTLSANTERRSQFKMRRPTADRDKAIMLLLLDTGIRASECCRLRIADLDIELGELTIHPCRSGAKSRPRLVYLVNSSY